MIGPAQDTDAWDRALTHLAEARAQDPDSSPAAIVHSTYYAMFHAARACLLRQGGSAPKKHDRLIQQFGLALKERAPEARQFARHLNRAWDQRIAADYDDPAGITTTIARECIQNTEAFISFCASEFGFRL